MNHTAFLVVLDVLSYEIGRKHLLTFLGVKNTILVLSQRQEENISTIIKKRDFLMSVFWLAYLMMKKDLQITTKCRLLNIK